MCPGWAAAACLIRNCIAKSAQTMCPGSATAAWLIRSCIVKTGRTMRPGSAASAWLIRSCIVKTGRTMRPGSAAAAWLIRSCIVKTGRTMRLGSATTVVRPASAPTLAVVGPTSAKALADARRCARRHSWAREAQPGVRSHARPGRKTSETQPRQVNARLPARHWRVRRSGRIVGRDSGRFVVSAARPARRCCPARRRPERRVPHAGCCVPPRVPPAVTWFPPPVCVRSVRASQPVALLVSPTAVGPRRPGPASRYRVRRPPAEGLVFAMWRWPVRGAPRAQSPANGGRLRTPTHRGHRGGDHQSPRATRIPRSHNGAAGSPSIRATRRAGRRVRRRRPSCRTRDSRSSQAGTS